MLLKSKYAYFFFSWIFFIHYMHGMHDQAVIRYPVADMDNDLLAMAEHHPVAPGPDEKGCQREHQGLFNEIAVIHEEKADAYKLSFDHVVYQNDQNPNVFWTRKKNLIRLREIHNQKMLQALPCKEYGQEPTIVLTYPWKHFSMGTRFKHIPEKDKPSSYAIVRADFKNNKVRSDYIPHFYAIPENRNRSDVDRRKDFVMLINQLLDRIEHKNTRDVIPYVWGGSSFVQLDKNNNFYQDDNGQDSGVWERKGKQALYAGYDCSEFVMRMAQIVGIDFPWKTSTMMHEHKKALTKDDILQDGDLIWIPGHIMIVGNIKKNELIESRGYASGFGCVHRIKLCDMFEDITSYDDLLQSYYHHTPLILKNKQGGFYLKEDNFSLLKLID